MKKGAWQIIVGIAAIIVAVIIFLVIKDARIAVFWLFGLGFGFILQRSRFCFASAFRDLYLLRDGRVMKGVLAGLAVATIGFALVMNNLLPTLVPGWFPINAGVTPVGFQILLAGVLFGLGMVIAGNCVSGTLFRIGEGYTASVVSLVGIMVGLGLILFTWNWWYLNYVSYQSPVWLPHYLGWGGGVLIILAVLAFCLLLVLWWESRGGLVVRKPVAELPSLTFSDKVRRLRVSLFKNPWPAVVGGVALGVMNILLYTFERPWGLIGEVSRWSKSLLTLVNLPPPEIVGAVGACPIGGVPPALLTWGLMINGGIIFGSFIGALLAGEFKLRIPRKKLRYLQVLIGGILMGYGAGLVGGCNVGAFFSAVPALGLNALIFAMALALGAFFGVQVIKRI